MQSNHGVTSLAKGLKLIWVRQNGLISAMQRQQTQRVTFLINRIIRHASISQVWHASRLEYSTTNTKSSWAHRRRVQRFLSGRKFQKSRRIRSALRLHKSGRPAQRASPLFPDIDQIDMQFVDSGFKGSSGQKHVVNTATCLGDRITRFMG